MPRLLLYTCTLSVVSGAVVFTIWGEVLQGWMVAYWLVVLEFWGVAFSAELQEIIGLIGARKSGVA
jgi:hypothetical protein